MAKKPLAYRGDEPFVFVSYAHADDKLAYPLIAGLQERGLRIWFDDGMDIGDLWDEVLAKRVKQCTAMLCLVSTRFTDSNNCLDEIHNAKEQKKELLILHLEDEVLPEIFQFRYSRFHALRLSAYSDQSELLDKLVATKKLHCCLGEVKGTSPEETPEDIYQKGEACYAAESFEEAVKWYRKAAELGHPEAMRRLGVCYALGQGVSQQHEEAVTWYRRAVDLGDAKAMYNLGLCYANGMGVALSHEEAVIWYRRAADKGNAIAMWNLGLCYENGWGVTKSWEEAATWYRQAAEEGNASAMFKLGYCYAKGNGVSQSDEEAVKWYRLSADKGNASAMCNLGYCYEKGTGVSKSWKEAIEWYRRGAENGNVTAMRNLGNCYTYGWGITKDKKQADYWNNKAKEAEAEASN